MVSVNQLALRQASPLPRLRQPPLSEVEPLRELTDLRLEPEHAIFEVRHSPVRRTGPDPGIGNFPPDDPPPVAIAAGDFRDGDGRRVVRWEVSDAGIGPSASDRRVSDLEDRMLGLESQVGELAERLDFTERLLAQARERGSLPKT